MKKNTMNFILIQYNKFKTIKVLATKILISNYKVIKNKNNPGPAVS